MFWPKNVLISCFLTQKCPHMTVFYPKLWHLKRTTLYYQTLRVIQLNALDDRSVTNKDEWAKAIHFIKTNLGQKQQQTAQKLYELTGPGKIASWWSWTWITEHQKRNKIIANELNKFLPSKVKESDPNHLTNEDVLTIRKQIEMSRPDCSLGSNATEAHGNIRAIWYQIYRLHFLKTSLDRCHSVQSKFYSAFETFGPTSLIWSLFESFKIAR